MASASDSRTMASDETEAASRPRDPAELFDFPFARQTSIYSLTLEEIQNAVLQPAGKTFGSMNMDDFLANIWSVEEASAPPAAAAPVAPPASAAPLRRQGSLTAPAPLSCKTVDEVWAQIHRAPDQPPLKNEAINGAEAAAPRQPTLGEMTLEDFLVKAGVVRECYDPVRAPPPPLPQPAEFPMAANGVYQMAVGPAVQRMGNGYGVGPASPGSSEAEGRYAKEEAGAAGGAGGRKRTADGVVEKVVERRQRRMIKNRESAARSRARKQAYTVELEAELNHLKEENTRLREEEKRMMALRKQLLLKSMNDQARSKSEKSVRTLRRVNSCPW